MDGMPWKLHRSGLTPTPQSVIPPLRQIRDTLRIHYLSCDRLPSTSKLEDDDFLVLYFQGLAHFYDEDISTRLRRHWQGTT